MIFNGVVAGFSLFMLVYWFRYSCLFILRTQPERDYARQVAIANRLHVFEVQTRLASAATGGQQSLRGLDEMLDRDYRLLLYLIRHATSFKTAGFELEQKMLACDYRMMKVVYLITKRISSGQGSRQLAEMAAIITRFANLMGERAALASS